MRPIDADALMDVIRQHEYRLATKQGSIDYGMFTLGIQQAVDEQPTIDAVPVVRCDSRVLEGHCVAESNFRFAGIENPFCCAGKLLKLSDTERKCDD